MTTSHFLCVANRMGDELDAALLLLELKRVYFYCYQLRDMLNYEEDESFT